MKTTFHTAIAAAAVAALSTLAAGSAFAQVTAPGAGTTSTPALRSVPPHVDKPGDHPRGAAEVRPNIAAGADNPQTPANTSLPPHMDKPGDHPRGAPGVKSNVAPGADNPQTPAHVDKPGQAAHAH